MWEERIRRWWMNNSGQSREDAEMEYLRLAQDLEMYGIQYYPICNSKETDLNLGVSAQGIGIYKGTNRITPRPFFSWSEIKNISFKNKVFSMKTLDKSTITFRAKDMSINMSILDLCIGTHNLYLRRRQPDLLEVQQMKAQAKEQRIRRMQEQNRLTREREQRIQAETERDRYKNEVSVITEKLNSVQEAMRKTEETAQLLAEKARVSEEEALVLSKRASEAEAECQRIKMSHMKAEETKLSLEKKARDAELMAHRLVEESERRNQEVHMYRSQLLASDPSWQNNWFSSYGYPSVHRYLSHHHLFPSSNRGDVDYGYDDEPPMAPFNPSLQRSTKFMSQSALNGPPPDPSINQFVPSDLNSLQAEIEQSRAEYKEKTKNLKEKLNEFRAELESLKVEERQSEHDRIHAANMNAGIDKFSTLRKSQAGTPKSRVQVFDGL
ncbi:hypothetical protein AB6A40_008170 [Gnathostoma spinigerum]|uniref:Moesin/ezrin/radixin homolog 1 n=1 Tax=Gnathostoma spinigerum TaxID=75299 RepID=A0ABD6EVG9_9BILA